MHSKTYPSRILFALVVLLVISVAPQMVTAEPVDQPWGMNLGGGFSPVVGGYNNTFTDGWNLTAGLGYKVTEKFGINLEYMNHRLGLSDSVADRFSNQLGGIDTDGNANVWSVTLNPTWKFEINDVVGGYVIGGGGYYHARAELTTPGLVYTPPYCDYYWGCWPGGISEADRIIGERKDDTGGVNLGVGFTFNIWHETQFYIETRYHYILIHGPDFAILPLTAGFRF